MQRVPPIIAGQTFGADQFRAWNNAIAELQNLAITDVKFPLQLRSGTLSAIPQNELIYVKNTGATNLDKYSVLAIDPDLPDPTDVAVNQFPPVLTYRGITPIAGWPGRFCITVDKIRAGETGQAVIRGIAQCKVNLTNEAYLFAESVDGTSTNLADAPIGSAQIVWRERPSGVFTPGVYNCIVRLNGPQAMVVTAAEDWEGGLKSLKCKVGDVEFYAGLLANHAAPLYADIKADDKVTLLPCSGWTDGDRSVSVAGLIVGYSQLPPAPTSEYQYLGYSVADSAAKWDWLRGRTS